MSDHQHEQESAHEASTSFSRRIFLRIGVILGLLAIPLTIYYAPHVAATIYLIVAFLSPLWLPVLLVCAAIPLWLSFTRSRFLSSVPTVVIELKPGENAGDAPNAMEHALYALYHREEVSRMDEMIHGRTRFPWAFELYAHAGSVRFFMHLPKVHQTSVEAKLRVEYPDIEIEEVRDYSREVHFSPFTMKLAMREYMLEKADPYPLRTYVADREGKEKRDAFNEFLQDLTDVSAHEHLFISWMVRSHQRERKSFLDDTAVDSLHEDAQEEITKLVGHKGDMRTISDSTRRVVAAIETALRKPSFDCGVRALYIAERPHFSTERAEGLPNLLKHFYDTELNGFVSYDVREQISWPLSELFIAAPILSMEYFLQLYRRRAFFAPPYRGRRFVLNTEELATVFHVPYITRQSALAGMRGLHLEPPENLPT